MQRTLQVALTSLILPREEKWVISCKTLNEHETMPKFMWFQCINCQTYWCWMVCSLSSLHYSFVVSAKIPFLLNYYRRNKLHKSKNTMLMFQITGFPATWRWERSRTICEWRMYINLLTTEFRPLDLELCRGIAHNKEQF